MTIFPSVRAFRVAAVLTAALAFGACSKNPNEDPSALGLAGAGAGAGAASPGSQQDFVVNVGDRVFFETDSVQLTPQAQATLDKQSQWLARYRTYSLTMEGHADERGTREYNFALGAQRAEAAKNYLIARGVPGNRIRTISFGKERPVAVCNDISCWSQNRRAVTLLGAGAGS